VPSLDSLGPLLGLFLASLAEATIVPMRSEVVLVGLLLAEQAPWPELLVVASLGNTLGASINWWLGRFIARFENRRWFPAKRSTIARAERWYHRWGRWTLLLSWMPVLGDVLTIAAGVLRESLPVLMLIVGTVKAVRYAIVIGLTLGWF
jgi:membrane protein YqaA with SNARE-associated domain